MNTIEDEVIGELRYLTVEFDQTELVTGGMGVISQDAVKRYFMKKCPNLKVKKCGGLKLDSERNIVTMRIGVVNQLGVENPVGVDPIVTDTFPGYGTPVQKLLGPGYDEIKAKCVTFQREYDAMVVLYDKLEARYSKLIEKYDALVEAVCKDAQKFSDLLVENEELEKEVNKTGLALLDAVKEIEKLTADPFSECPHCVENEKLKLAHDKLLEYTRKIDFRLAKYERADRKTEIDFSPEDSADLAEAKKVIAEDDAIDLDVFEDEIIGPFSESAPTIEEVADAAVKVAESNMTGKPLLAPRKEITQKEAKKQFEITGADGSKIEGEKAEKVSVTAVILDEFAGKDNDYSAAQKLLNPGYDELKKKCDELQHEKDIVGRLYDALVVIAARDEQKFTDLLVENDELKAKCVTFQREYDAMVVLYDKLEARYSKLIEKYDELREAHDRLLEYTKKIDFRLAKYERADRKTEIDFSSENSADLVEAKKTITEDDAADLNVIEGEANG